MESLISDGHKTMISHFRWGKIRNASWKVDGGELFRGLLKQKKDWRYAIIGWKNEKHENVINYLSFRFGLENSNDRVRQFNTSESIFYNSMENLALKIAQLF